MAEKQYPSERKDRYIVRLPDGMRDKIKAGATGGRSMNDIIVAALEQYFRLEEEREAGWRWVPPKYQIDAGLIGELEAIANADEFAVPVPVSINAAVSSYIALHYGDQKGEAHGDRFAVTEEGLGALAKSENDRLSARLDRIEKLLQELVTK